MDSNAKKTLSGVICLLFLIFHQVCCKPPSRSSSKQFDLAAAKKIVTNAFMNITSQQSVCFIQNETIVESQALIQSLSNRTSTYVIDIQTFRPGKNQKTFNLSLFAYPRQSTMYFILKKATKEKLFTEVKDIFPVFDELSPIVTRPRCALVIYGRILGITKGNFGRSLEDLLQHAWSLKYLDFTVVHVLPRKNPMVYILNPFENVISNFSLTFNSTSPLFPNKLMNVKNHTIHVPIPDVHNGTCVFRDRNTGELEQFMLVTANFFIFLKQFFEYTNITVSWDIDEMTYVTFLIMYNIWLGQLATSKLAILPTFFQRSGDSAAARQAEVSRWFHFSAQEIFVPNIKTTKFSFPFELLETAMLFAAVIFSCFIVARSLKFSKKEWSIKKIVFLLAGVDVRCNSTKFFERTFYICLSLLSLTVTSDLIGSFLGFLREEKLITYQNLNDINETNMRVLTFDYVKWSNDSDDVARDIMEKTTAVEFSADNYVIFKEPFIFIGPRFYGAAINNLIQKFFPAYPNYLLPSNITLYETGSSFAFAKNSPYVEMFDKVALRTKGFGLDVVMESRYNHRCTDDTWFDFEFEEPLKSEDVSGICVFILFCFGAAFSCIIFFWEICSVGNSRKLSFRSMSFRARESRF